MSKKKPTKKKTSKKQVAKSPKKEMAPKPPGYVFGRPTKYREEYCQMLIDHMAKGYSFEAFAGVVNISTSNLYEWVGRHEAFQEARNIAFNKSMLFWEKVGKGGATGQIKGFSAAAWIFNMKNRFKWSDRQDFEVSARYEKDIKTIEKMSPRELARLANQCALYLGERDSEKD